MKLWHKYFIPYLPKSQLLGQRRYKANWNKMDKWTSQISFLYKKNRFYLS